MTTPIVAYRDYSYTSSDCGDGWGEMAMTEVTGT